MLTSFLRLLFLTLFLLSFFLDRENTGKTPWFIVVIESAEGNITISQSRALFLCVSVRAWVRACMFVYWVFFFLRPVKFIVWILYIYRTEYFLPNLNWLVTPDQPRQTAHKGQKNIVTTLCKKQLLSEKRDLIPLLSCHTEGRNSGNKEGNLNQQGAAKDSILSKEKNKSPQKLQGTCAVILVHSCTWALPVSTSRRLEQQSPQFDLQFKGVLLCLRSVRKGTFHYMFASSHFISPCWQASTETCRQQTGGILFHHHTFHFLLRSEGSCTIMRKCHQGWRMSPFSANVLREGEREQEFGGNPSSVGGHRGRWGSWVRVPGPDLSNDVLSCHSQN